jgi:hypothetical protein
MNQFRDRATLVAAARGREGGGRLFSSSRRPKIPEGLYPSSPLARFGRIECRVNNKPPTARASGHGGGHLF